jgi:RNA polymerase sigma-70 factor (ECF subfamily)
LEETDTQGNLRWQPVDEVTAERSYERKWATTLLDRVLIRLEGEYARQGRITTFKHLQPYLLEPSGQPAYAEVGRLLGRSDQALRKEVSRLRQRFRQLFQEEIARTVNGPGEIDGEMRHLFVVLTR